MTDRDAENWEKDVRARMRTDMASTLRQRLTANLQFEELLDALVEDGMFQVYKAWEEGRPS